MKHSRGESTKPQSQERTINSNITVKNEKRNESGEKSILKCAKQDKVRTKQYAMLGINFIHLKTETPEVSLKNYS